MEYCVCGHDSGWHFKTAPRLDCFANVEKNFNGRYYANCPCNEFKLDNLKLIEDLAKERNLV